MKFLAISDTKLENLTETVRMEPIAILHQGDPIMAILPVDNSNNHGWPAEEYEQLLVHAKHLRSAMERGESSNYDPSSRMKFIAESEVELDKLQTIVNKQPVAILREGKPVMLVLPIGNSKDITWSSKEYDQLLVFAKHLRKAIEQVKWPRVEPGIIEVSLALAGIAIALAVFLPEARENLSNNTKLVVAIFLCVVAFISSFSGLWFLAHYCFPDKPLYDLGVIPSLLIKWELGPYWFKSIGLLALLLLSVVVGVLAVTVQL